MISILKLQAVFLANNTTYGFIKLVFQYSYQKGNCQQTKQV